MRTNEAIWKRVLAVFLGLMIVPMTTPGAGNSQSSAPPAQNQLRVRSGARPTVDQELSSGLWRVDGNFQSNIQIYNKHILKHRSIVPVLYMADGTEYNLPAQDLAPNSLTTISVNDAIESAPPQMQGHISLYGSASIHFLSPTADSASAAIQVLDAANSLSFIYPFHAADDMDAMPHTFGGLWWRRDAGVTGFIALANRTSQSLQLSLQATGSAGTSTPLQTITLAARASQLLSLADLTASLPANQKLMGGLHVSFTGKASDLMISGGLENKTEGYSAAIPFVLHDAATNAPSATTLASTGIMVGQPDPAMKFPQGATFFPYTYLRNSSGSSMKVERALYYTLAAGGGQQVTLPSLTISPGGTVQAPLDFGAVGLGGYSGQITESFSTVSNPGDLIVATGSTDQTANYVFEVLPQLVATTKSLQGHFWRVGGGYDSMTTLWNSGTAAEDLLITISFAGGNGHYKLPVHLAPGATTTIDVAELINEAKPDSDGNIIPPSASGGGMIVSGKSDFLDDINIIIGGGTFSVFGATCYPECYTCGPLLEGFGVGPSPVQSSVGGNTQMTATATLSTGTQLTETGNTKWSSTNSSVATITSGGLVTTAFAAGSATIDGVIEWPDESTTCYPNPCQEIAYTGPAPVLVPTMVEPIATLSQGSVVCSNGSGWSRIVTNQLQYQNGQGIPQSGIKMDDTLTFTSPNQLGLSPDTGEGTTGNNGSWSDIYADCTSYCPSSGESDALQSWTWNSVGLPHVNLVAYKCSSITIDGN